MQLTKHIHGLTGERHNQILTHFHSLTGNVPFGTSEINMRPLCLSELSGTNESKWR